MGKYNLVEVDLKPLAKVANNLIDKLADAVGWVADRKSLQQQAVDMFIKDIQEKEKDPLKKAAYVSNARKIVKEYQRQQNIVKIALSSLSDTAQPDKLADDWLIQYMDKSRNVCSEEFQWIWGEILARECNEPGSIPVALLHILEQMDREDAEAFSALCRMTVYLGEECAPVVIHSRSKDYEKMGLRFDNIVNLNALGLINCDFSNMTTYTFENKDGVHAVRYFDKEYQLKEDESINIGNVIYTKYGVALCKSIEVEEIEGFWEGYCVKYWDTRRKYIEDQAKVKQILLKID